MVGNMFSVFGLGEDAPSDLCWGQASQDGSTPSNREEVVMPCPRGLSSFRDGVRQLVIPKGDGAAREFLGLCDKLRKKLSNPYLVLQYWALYWITKKVDLVSILRTACALHARVSVDDPSATSDDVSGQLLLGQGKQPVSPLALTPLAGVEMFVWIPSCVTSHKTLVVSNVNAYPGHIACYVGTKSDVVCTLILRIQGREVPLGVLDLDCLAQRAFEQVWKGAKIARLVVAA